MGNLHLVTGYQGTEHVTAADHGSLYAAIFGSGSYVLDRGNKLAATVVTNNQIRIADGDIILQGRHIRLNEGATVDLTIENGAQGYYRNDLICVRYTRNSGTGVEDASLVVIKGTAMTASPADPAYNNGDLLTDNAETVDFPLYRVPLSGITVQPLVALFKIIPAYGEGGLDYVPNDEKGKANGVATLDSSGKVPSSQLPSMNYIPTNQKGAASGVAPLNASKKVALTYLPVSDGVTGGSSTIATSVAVKTAYDKAVSAQSAANEAINKSINTYSMSRSVTSSEYTKTDDGGVTINSFEIEARQMGNIVSADICIEYSVSDSYQYQCRLKLSERYFLPAPAISNQVGFAGKCPGTAWEQGYKAVFENAYLTVTIMGSDNSELHGGKVYFNMTYITDGTL